jgi:hypothetical protein
MLVAAAALAALTGCGHHGSTNPNGGPPPDAGPAPEATQLLKTCTDTGPVLTMIVGLPSCAPTATMSSTSYFFFISGQDYARLGAGVTLTIGPDQNSPTFGYLVTQVTQATDAGPMTLQTMGVPTPAESGSIKFDTYEANKGATGSFEARFPSGGVSVSFLTTTADFCPPMACVH